MSRRRSRGVWFWGAGDDAARRLVVHGAHVNHLAQINAFASNRDMDELRVLCIEGHHEPMYRIRNKCEQLFLQLQFDGLGKNRYAVITRKSYELSHDGRFLSGSQNGQTRNATSEQVLRRLKEKDNGNWVYFPTSPQFQAAWKGALGGESRRQLVGNWILQAERTGADLQWTLSKVRRYPGRSLPEKRQTTSISTKKSLHKFRLWWEVRRSKLRIGTNLRR